VAERVVFDSIHDPFGLTGEAGAGVLAMTATGPAIATGWHRRHGSGARQAAN